MKNTITILLSCIAFLIGVITVNMVNAVELDTAIAFVKENGVALAAAPIIVSTNITEELLTQMKVKFGKIKIITVVVETPVYDIDNLTSEDRANMRILNIDASVIGQKALPITERLKPLNNLHRFEDNELELKAAKALTHLNGTIIEEGEQYQFLIKRPDRSLIKMLLPLAQGGHIDDFAEKGVKNLVVGGDMDALEDGIVFMGVVSQLKEMIAPAQAFLSKA